jgi:LPXTG-motif cell wall-anchored protein
MAQRRTLRILDAKSAHRAWSKRRMMVVIATAAIAASVAAPAVARAEEVQALPAEQPAIVVAEQAAPTPEAAPEQPAGAVVQEVPAGEPSAPADVTTAEGTQNPAGSAQGEDDAVAPEDEAKSEETPSAGESVQTGEGAETAEEPQEAVPSQPAQGTEAAGSEADATKGEEPQQMVDAKLDGIEFTRTDEGYDQTTDPKISMTEKRDFQVTVGVDGVDVDALQKMIDEGSVKFSLSRDKGAMDPKTYPKQYLGGGLEDWMTVAAVDKRKGVNAPSIPFFSNVLMKAELVDGKSSIVLRFGNELLCGVNGIDVRARSLVRSAMYDYVGTYKLACTLANGQTVSTDVELRPYDEFHTQEEIDAALPKFVEEALKNGIYAKVETFGKSAEGRDMKAIFVAGSESDLTDYQNLKKLMESNPAAVQEQLKSGKLQYKVPVFYSNVHADEVVAVDAVMQFIRDLVECVPIDYTRITGYTEAGKEELKKEMEADGTVWSGLFKDEVTGIGYIRGNGGDGNGVEFGDNRSKGGHNDASSDLSDADFDKYYTSVRETFNPKEILKHVFFILVPSENVDARTDNVRTNGNGFDLNRDNTYQTQPETQAMAGLIAKWDPISLHEVHGYYQQFQIEPCSPAHDPNNEYDLFIDTALKQGEYFASTALANTKTINSAQIPIRDYLKKQDDGSVAWDAPFDDMSTSYTPQYAMMHGTNAYTVEVPIGNSDALHALEYGFIGNAQFVINNKDRMFWNMLERFRRGVENIDSPDIRKYYVNQKDEPGAEADIFRPQDNENHNFFPEYYVIPMDALSQQDRAAAAETVQFLLHNGVRVSRLTHDVMVGGKAYKAGAIVVDMHQAKRNMANCALYPNLLISDWTQYSLYSEPLTNFSALRGYDMDTIRKKGAFAKEFLEDVTAVPDPKTYVQGSGPVTIIRNDSLQSIRAVNDLLKQGKKVGLIREGSHEGSYVVSTEDFNLVKDKYVLYAIQGKATPKASTIRNDLKVYVPKAYTEFVTDAGGNEVGMSGYNNRLNTNGNWDFFALAKQMGFTLTDNLDEATIIVGSQYPSSDVAEEIAKKIAEGVPYIGYTSDALQFVKDAGLADISFTGEDWDWMGYDALDTVVFPEDDIITATYRIEGDRIMYGYGGSYFVSIPKGAKVLIRTTDDQPIEGFMTAEFLEKYKGQIQAISILDGKADMVLFANTLTNKAHQQDDYRYLTASVYSRSLAGDYGIIPVPDEPEKPAEPGNAGSAIKPSDNWAPSAPAPEDRVELNREGGVSLRTAAQHQRDSVLPQTGDSSLSGSGLAAMGIVLLASGGAIAFSRRQEHDE